jgi:predicted  nucleic acid-binding Zn-ribbon protein
MHPQLELLIMLHDVDLLLKELENSTRARQESDFGFVIDHNEEVAAAKAKIEEQLDSKLLEEYRRLAARYGRAVAPVVDGICYGCFIRLPTDISVSKQRNEELFRCLNCGRYLYWIAKRPEGV